MKSEKKMTSDHRNAHLMSWQNDFHILPQSVCGDLVCHKILKLLMQSSHELCSWSDAVWVKPCLWGQSLTTFTGLLFKNFRLLGWSEPEVISYFNGKHFYLVSVASVRFVKCCYLTVKIHFSNSVAFKMSFHYAHVNYSWKNFRIQWPVSEFMFHLVANPNVTVLNYTRPLNCQRI